MLSQCCFDAGPSSTTLAQHQNNIAGVLVYLVSSVHVDDACMCLKSQHDLTITQCTLNYQYLHEYSNKLEESNFFVKKRDMSPSSSVAIKADSY